MIAEGRPGSSPDRNVDPRGSLSYPKDGVLLPVTDLRPSRLGLQLGARMRRHADSISEWNNLFTNLPDAGRLGVHRRSRRGSSEDRRSLCRGRTGTEPPRRARWRTRVACHRCVDVWTLAS